MTAPIAVVDALASLLEATQNSVFRFMGEGSPYLSRAAAEVRRPLADMVNAEQRRSIELAHLIESLGGTLPTGHVNRRDDQFLSYLALKFLLPKLVTEKRLLLERYENTLKSIGTQAPNVTALLQAHLNDMRQELAQLERASNNVVAAAKAEAHPPHP